MYIYFHQQQDIVNCNLRHAQTHRRLNMIYISLNWINHYCSSLGGLCDIYEVLEPPLKLTKQPHSKKRLIQSCFSTNYASVSVQNRNWVGQVEYNLAIIFRVHGRAIYGILLMNLFTHLSVLNVCIVTRLCCEGFWTNLNPSHLNGVIYTSIWPLENFLLSQK